MFEGGTSPENFNENFNGPSSKHNGEEDLEMQQLASNRSVLEQIAKTTGGKYYDESQADRVNESLQALRTGKIEQSRTLLWQSYPWFLAIMTLLALEWYLRKRAGFI
jgi:hypothetical protein